MSRATESGFPPDSPFVDYNPPRPTDNPPRDRRIGGYVMPHETVQKWAARLLGFEKLTRDQTVSATLIINERIRKYGVRIWNIGEEVGHYCMLITQAAPFKGHLDMPASEIPQFIPGELEEKARNFLLASGVAAEDLTFETWLG
ncbi:hypothetical protein Hypma_014010 [Hypsizygus marmoreus]|uniref:Uncharacterized protein n=1 Tax=Hypsizygus marmoreus TaxID=39966 RepID=A0A369K8U6_HYPMA|nr:hypothetical protein Hypma_014010 [Hypsizygus marmoreus]